MSTLTPLPPSEDKSFWSDNVHTVKLSDLKDALCKTHAFKLDAPNRTLQCVQCGFGGRITPSNVEIKGDKIVINRLGIKSEHYLLLNNHEIQKETNGEKDARETNANQGWDE